MINICKQCRNEFKTYIRTKKFCSRKCYGINRHSNRNSRPCKGCNKRFYVPKSQVDRRYCSSECRIKGQKKIIKKTGICRNCGIDFKYDSRLGDHGREYCSDRCKNKVHGLKTKTLICPQCGKKFTRQRKHLRKYCSDECRYKFLHYKENNNHYISEVHKIKKDGLKECQKCGYKKYTEILGIHHKDFNRKNNLINNLIVLCPNCHSIEHHKNIIHHQRPAVSQSSDPTSLGTESID